MQTANYTLLRDANVTVRDIQTPVITKANERKIRHEAEITIDGQWTHRFPHDSRVSKHLELMTPAQLGRQMTGGKFFLVEDELIDFRYGSYAGFVHDDDSIAKMMELLGFENRSQLPLHRRRRRSSDDQTTDIVLRKVWDDHQIDVAGITDGGVFSSQLSFVWNPFVHTINAAFDLVRLICTNGMVGLTSLFNSRIPLFNRWEEHLDISCKQIQNKVAGIVRDRSMKMLTQRATLADVLVVNDHVTKRLEHATGDEQRDRLRALQYVTNARTHMSNVYTQDVFDDRNHAVLMPGHLSMYDVYNVVTELRTHTDEHRESTARALDMISNNLMFERAGQNVMRSRTSTMRATPSFADPERAFYGTLLPVAH